MAMTVMAIGGAAVITMQKTSVTANLDARKADVANAIARTWVERLQRESMRWTLPNRLNMVANNLGSALILNNVNNATGRWFLPNQELGLNGPIETMSPGFDILGRDLPLADLPTADFCVNVRLSWLATSPTPGNTLIRADVRVIWPMMVLNSLPNFCNVTTAQLADPNTDTGAIRYSGADPNQPVFHALYLTTTIRENTAQQ
jgi:hypothetical protein